MEFYATTDIPTSANELQRRLTVGKLPEWCASIEKVLAEEKAGGEIFCMWGTFKINREQIRGGVRFTLPGCANVLQWTVTTELPPDPSKTIVHLTINRTEHDPEFIESMQQFVDDWKTGLESHWY